MKYCTRGNIFILPVSCLSQGDSDPVYDDVSTVPKTRGAGQRVAAHREEEDDVQYASVLFTPNKEKQEVPRQKEDAQYASIQFSAFDTQEARSIRIRPSAASR